MRGIQTKHTAGRPGLGVVECLAMISFYVERLLIIVYAVVDWAVFPEMLLPPLGWQGAAHGSGERARACMAAGEGTAPPDALLQVGGEGAVHSVHGAAPC